MELMNRRISLAAILIFSAAVGLAAPAPGVLGYWRTPTGSVIGIAQCGANICLRIAALAPKVPTTDIHNPDPALRSRALCNLQIGSGFMLNDADHASGGTLYDPKSGKTYRGAIAADGSALHLRGYVGIPLFGASQTWTRTTKPVISCNAIGK